MVESDVVDAVILFPAKIFRNTTTAVCMWVLSNNKNRNGIDRSGKVLMINAQDMWIEDPKNRTLRIISDGQIQTIADAYTKWKTNLGFQNTSGFAKSVLMKEIEKRNFDLSPKKYVGHRLSKSSLIDDFEMSNAQADLREQMQRLDLLDNKILNLLTDLQLKREV